jgi:FAD/FMN-containing dehydrogenase
MMSGNGPSQMDFNRLLTQSQGTMGIVTWAGVRLHYLPAIHKLYIAPAKKEEDLNNFVYRILRLRFADELMIVNSPYLASLLGESADRIAELKRILPTWAALVGIAGYTYLPELRVAAQEQDCAEIAQQFGLRLQPAVPGAGGREVLEAIINPSKEPYFKQRARGAFQDIFFITTLDKTPGFISAIYSLAQAAGYPTSDIGVYIQPQHAGTSVHCEFSLPYDPADNREAEQVKNLYFKASEVLSAMGAFYARPYGCWARLQYQKDAAMTIALKKIKGIFDPNGIMNPGKLCNY